MNNTNSVAEAILKVLNGTIRFEKNVLRERGVEYSVENISKKYLEHMVEVNHER